MKRILILFAALAALAANSASAQTMKLDSDGITFGSADRKERNVSISTVVSYKSKGLTVGRGIKSSIPMLELGWNIPSAVNYDAYEGTPYGEFFDVREWKSTQFTINLLQASAFNKARNLGISVALGIKANNYRLRNTMSLTDIDGLTVPVELEGRVKKSKFTTAALHIPVEVSFGNPYRFAFSVGGFVDMTMNSHTKVKYRGGSKDKEHNFPVEFIQAGLSARFSFRNFSIYGNYTPTRLFKSGRGPEMSVWTIGIGW